MEAAAIFSKLLPVVQTRGPSHPFTNKQVNTKISAGLLITSICVLAVNAAAR